MTASTVGDLFFPRSAELGLAVEDTVSPRVLAKMVYSGTSSASFAEASENLAKLADLSISSERVRRACRRVASDRIDHHQRLGEAYHRKSLPEQAHGKPADAKAPDIACVMSDGGRYQLRVQARFYVVLHRERDRSIHLYCFHMASQRLDFA